MLGADVTRFRRRAQRDAGQPHASGLEQLLRRNVTRFRGGLVCKAHRLVYHSTLGSRVIKKKKRRSARPGNRGVAAIRIPRVPALRARVHHASEREFCIDNLLARIHCIIVMIRWTGLAICTPRLPALRSRVHHPPSLVRGERQSAFDSELY